MVSEKLKLGSEFKIDHSDKTDTFDVLKHFTGIDLEQDRDPQTARTSRPRPTAEMVDLAKKTVHLTEVRGSLE